MLPGTKDHKFYKNLAGAGSFAPVLCMVQG